MTKNKKGFTLVEIMIVVVIIGLLAAMAVPAFQRVRRASQQKTVLNNLRQIASAAQRYILEEGVTSVGYTALVSAGYFADIQTVAQENYTGITIDIDDSVISVSNSALSNVIYTF